jgi:hypothetical protein
MRFRGPTRVTGAFHEAQPFVVTAFGISAFAHVVGRATSPCSLSGDATGGYVHASLAGKGPGGGRAAAAPPPLGESFYVTRGRGVVSALGSEDGWQWPARWCTLPLVGTVHWFRFGKEARAD